MTMPDARGWIGIGVYSLSIMVLWMYAAFPDLRADDHFKALMTLVVGTGFINGLVSWAYSATKSGGELADKNAAIVAQQADTANTTANTLNVEAENVNVDKK